MSDKIRNILKSVSEDPNLLQRLISQPKAIAEEYKLDRDETARLAHSNVLIAAAHNPLVETVLTTQTTSPITITVTTGLQFDTGYPNPLDLHELPYERLVEVAHRILVDPEYAARVRTFLNL